MDSFLGIDYATWWYLVVGGVFTGYAILDGFDLGAGAWHLFIRKEENRRIALNAVGPVWDGNEVWLVIGGGALFAGFPKVYASLLSAMYIPFMLFLVMLIFRAISIEFRSKEPMAWWRRLWDVSYSVSSVVLAVLLGVVLGNVLQGIAIDKNGDHLGHWLDFLNPYALSVGLLTLLLFMVHGGIYLGMKTEGRLFAKLYVLLKWAMLALTTTFGIVTVWTLAYIPQLSDRFLAEPIYLIIPALAFLSLANVPRLIARKRFKLAFFFSALMVALLLITVAVELYPVILMSTVDRAFDLTVQNAASSSRSLGIMLTFAAVGVPLVAGYTFFVYRTFYGKVKMDEHSY
ncbi:MAG: cytochrome d ubiquinol oxidase subunit II [Flavobacteriales bacterium]